LKVPISKGSSEGFVLYNETDQAVDVSLTDPIEETLVENFFNQVRDFKIPESQRIDDYRIDKVKPIESEMYMRLALCVLHSETGFWVHWEKAEG